MTLFAAFRAAPHAARIDAPAEQVERIYRYWRLRILYSTVIGYAFFYLVRTNIGVALPAMEKSLALQKSQLGMIMTLGGLTYGVSKLVNGFVGDRANPRLFMPLGLIASAAMNLLFGFSMSLNVLATFWLLNGWFQGMGFPPCARSMSHWFAPSERSSSFGIWNMGHQLGAAGSAVLSGYLVTRGWQWCFIVPALIAMIGAIWLLDRLRDDPESMGLPPVEEYRGEALAAAREADAAHEEAHQSHWRFVRRHVLAEKFVWIVSIANFFVYTMRYAVLNWGPTFLAQTKGTSLRNTGWLTGGSELAGLLGALLGGWVTDRYFRGRAGRVCVLATIALAAVVYFFWKTPSTSPLIYATLFIAMGFLIYIPQLLVAVIAMNISTKRAAATAVGLTGIFGYASTVLSGWGIGKLVDVRGWDIAFELMLACCAIMLVLLSLTWNLTPTEEQRC